MRQCRPRSLSPLPENRTSRAGSADLPARNGIDQAAPAAAVERLPVAFGLREAIGDRIDGGGVMAHAAMAAFDFDAFGHCRRFLLAALPGANTVGAAEDRR